MSKSGDENVSNLTGFVEFSRVYMNESSPDTVRLLHSAIRQLENFQRKQSTMGFCVNRRVDKIFLPTLLIVSHRR
jgi:hypothetical protein